MVIESVRPQVDGGHYPVKRVLGEEVEVSFRVTMDGELRKAKGRIVRMETGHDNPREIWSHRLAIAFNEPQAELHGLFRSVSSRPPPPA